MNGKALVLGVGAVLGGDINGILVIVLVVTNKGVVSVGASPVARLAQIKLGAHGTLEA